MVTDRAGFENRIVFDAAFDQELRSQATWKVVGFRVDPALGNGGRRFAGCQLRSR